MPIFLGEVAINDKTISLPRLVLLSWQWLTTAAMKIPDAHTSQHFYVHYYLSSLIARSACHVDTVFWLSR